MKIHEIIFLYHFDLSLCYFSLSYGVQKLMGRILENIGKKESGSMILAYNS